MNMKFLIIRFSSIGDIVFTTPVIRCLRKRFPDAEIHFLTKLENKLILDSNPYLNKVLCLNDSLFSTIVELRKENYTAVIDLHKNLRTFLIKSALLKPNYTFQKLNWEKFLITQFHYDILPRNLHITERNLAAVEPLGVHNDEEGTDYFIPIKDEVKLNVYGLEPNNFIAWVVGAKHFTKVLPIEKVLQTIALLQQSLPLKKIVLLGGKDEIEFGNNIQKEFGEQVMNFCGKLNLNASASLIQQSEIVVSGDTGLLHIAIAVGKPVVSVWGSTIPEFGVFPLYGKSKKKPFEIIEVKNLPCRPCTKFGKNNCPQGHFNCMNNIEAIQIAQAIQELMEKKKSL
jgi:heptosyltransferase-2